MAADGTQGFQRVVGSPPIGRKKPRRQVSFTTSSNGDRNSATLPTYIRTPEVGQTLGRVHGRKQSGPDISDNWMLKDSLEESRRQFESKKVKLFVKRPDDDAMVHIERRLAEIREMATSRRKPSNALDDFSKEMQRKILKIDAMSPSEIRVLTGHSSTNARDMIRWAGRMMIILNNGTRYTEKYFIEPKKTRAEKKRRASMYKPGVVAAAATKSSLTREMQLHLTVRPRYRNSRCLKKVMWLLRATKAFAHLFPAEMETELARHVAYERYDDGRVIAWQGRPPDRIYYVIGGRMAKLRQYNLWTGHITKTMSYLTKGMTTDLTEMEKQWLREDSLVAVGDVEVLFLDKEACQELLHTTSGTPFEFLRSLDLFKGFPEEVFASHADAFEVLYFAQHMLVVKDANRTPWLHVIKSGHVKVIRRQLVFDVRTLNQNIFRCSRIEQIGYGRQFSHASAMLGVQAKQKKLKAARTVILPSIKHTNGPSGNAFVRPTGIGVTPDARRCSTSRHDNEDSDVDYGDQLSPESDDEYTRPPTITFEQDKAASPPSVNPASSRGDVTEIGEQDVESPRDHDESSQSEKETLPDGQASSLKPVRVRRQRTWLNIPVLSDDETVNRTALWLTREKTELETPRVKKGPQCRFAFLELDTLTAGDVFGLDHMQQARASEPPGLGLLSDGAEIVRVNKRFFLQHAGNNAMLKIETNQKEYISEEDARRALYNKETWDQYKSALWQRMEALHCAPFLSSR